MSTGRLLSTLFLIILLSSCQVEVDPDLVAVRPQCFRYDPGTHLPYFANSAGKLTLSTVYENQHGHHLQKTRFMQVNGSGSVNRGTGLIVKGKDWFVNWADYPGAEEYLRKDGTKATFAHWRTYSGEGTYDYDIRIFDWAGGQKSKRPLLHNDGVSAEHGFVSTAALPGGDLQVTWLDGRFTKQDEGAAAGAKKVDEAKDEHRHAAEGAMTLRTKALSESGSTELDHRVCDCCNTSTIATDSLVVVAYRDRSEHEIRDISYVLKRTGSSVWSTPKTVHADNWEVSGCPVNGPALAEAGPQNIAIVWYTAPRDRALINFSRYDPSDDRFSPPLLLDDDAPLGRVDLQLLPDGTAFATGLTKHPSADSSYLTLWTISPDDKVIRENLATTHAGRSSGFPRTAIFEDHFFWARTVNGMQEWERYVEVCHRPLDD